ncbi:MAG: HIT domain-containing protein [Helicobacteraceae bacterium]|nr:HIT domain-containing protein [Helicobacteraceae bacterium]
MSSKIYENDLLFIEVHESHIPWLKIFTKKVYKEFSECPQDLKLDIFNKLDIIEKSMISFYEPEKINIASFGNMLPHVHWHIMARFTNDGYFPEPMWGAKKEEATLNLPSFEKFKTILLKDL